MSGDTPPGTTLKCPHSEAVRKRWGDSVSEARWAALRALRDRQRGWAAKPEAGCGASHFKNVPLTGADAFWLAEAPGRNEVNCVPNLRLEGADLDGAQLEGAVVTDLRWAHLEGGRSPRGAPILGRPQQGAPEGRPPLRAPVGGPTSVRLGWTRKHSIQGPASTRGLNFATSNGAELAQSTSHESPGRSSCGSAMRGA